MMKKFIRFLHTYRNALLAWLGMAILIEIGIVLSIDKSAIAFAVVLLGLIGHAFTALIVWIGLVPVVGPIAAQILTMPFIWILNGIGYVASVIAIKRGYSKDVLNYRIITITLLVGITLGYILGKLI
ncbi:MAG: hypothetical protein V1799_03185 [bacterium]